MPHASVETQYAHLTSNATTTSTSAADIAGMSFSVAANEKWAFDCYMKIGTSSNAGTKYAVNVPVGATFTAYALGTTSTAAARSEEYLSTDATLTTTAWNTANLSTAAVGAFIHIHGVVTNGANAGTVNIMHAKVTSGTATVYAGSYMRSERLA